MVSKKIGMLFAISFLSIMLIFVSFASADKDSVIMNAQMQDSLNVSLCQVNYISNLASSFGQSNLTTYSDKLNIDFSQLQSYASTGDSNDFKNFMVNDYRSDLQSSTSALSSMRNNLQNNRNVAPNIPRGARGFGNRSEFNRSNFMNNSNNQLNYTAIAASNQALKSQYQSCLYSALQQEGQDRINYFNLVISNFQADISSLATKGYDVTSLNVTVENAQNEVVLPLQFALSSANNASSITADLKEYCLFDGCVNGINAHLDASYSIARLNLALERLNNINDTNMTNQLAQAQNYLNSASTALSNVGTAKYTQSSSSQVWSNISLAKKSILQAIHDLSLDLKAGI